MNKKFYQLTTNNLNDNQTYQKMRGLARNKYDLNLHEVYLPSQNLETGKDILELVRNLASFAKGYTHNLHSQQFVEIVKDSSSYINIIGVQQILTIEPKRKMDKGLTGNKCRKKIISISKKYEVTSFLSHQRHASMSSWSGWRKRRGHLNVDSILHAALPQSSNSSRYIFSLTYHCHSSLLNYSSQAFST